MQKTEKQPIGNLILLILAGEAVFILPFVLARIFRPTFLEVFDLTNTELGLCFSIYGFVALISYFFGGFLADRFRPGVLMGIALILTALGGIPMASFPSYSTMQLIFGYWGFTTILLFWAAMIKATRSWGGTNRQGIAFGFLDAGRGLVAASFGLLGVLIFSSIAANEIVQIDIETRKAAFRSVILYSSAIVALIGVVLLFIFKNSESKEPASFRFLFPELIRSLKLPSVWLLMAIVLCGYVGYKTTDIFSQYANEVMLYDEVESAQIGTFLLYMRPVTGVLFGLLADRMRVSFWLLIGFLTMLAGALTFSTGVIDHGMHIPFILLIISTGIGVYAIRALYFAAIQEGNIPLAITGTVVGIISLVGYTPDIFMGPIIGYFLDGTPGKEGHQSVFFLLFCFAFAGAIATFLFHRSTKKTAS